MIHVTAMAMLILTNPTVFQESAQMNQVGESGYGGSPFSSEDLHRAFQLLKFHLRHKSAAKSDNSFYESTEEGPVRETRYFTQEELKTAETTKGMGADGDGQDAVHPMEQLARVEDGGPEEREEDTRTFTQEEADFDQGVELVEGISSQPPSELDPERAGAKEIRPPLSLAAQRALCERLAKRVKVLHEESWTELEPGEDAEVRPQTIVCDPHPTDTDQEMFHRAVDYTDTSDGTEQNGGSVEPDQAFWKLMNKISTVSAPTPSYKDACDELHLDPKEPRLMSAGGDGVVLNPWQVIGMAWAMGQEAGPSRGGVIADACGIGKTIQMLSVISESVSIAQRRAEYVPPGVRVSD